MLIDLPGEFLFRLVDALFDGFGPIVDLAHGGTRGLDQQFQSKRTIRCNLKHREHKKQAESDYFREYNSSESRNFLLHLYSPLHLSHPALEVQLHTFLLLIFHYVVFLDFLQKHS